MDNKYLTYILLIVFSKLSFAVEKDAITVELSPIAELSAVNLHQDQWHSVIPVIGSEEEYFLATKSGKIYTLNNKHISNSSLLDLKTAIDNPNIVALTAIALDPSFNYPDRKGFNTFYTAHVERRNVNKLQNTKNTHALNESTATIALSYDAVIMRWQLSKNLEQVTEIKAQHEVIRIAIHHEDEAIMQLSFNPYTESWHNDFGLLYALMASSKMAENLDKPLYSGVILRIRPERFGLQSYTIPIDNPFTKHTDIRNEIVLIAGADIVSFDWMKKGAYSLLVQLEKSQEHQFIQAKLGDDWRQDLPSHQRQTRVALNVNSANSMLYHGRELKSLWGQILQLEQKEGGWHLQAIKLETSIQQSALPTINSHGLSHATAAAKFSLHKSRNSELLLLEHNQQLLYAIKAVKQPTKKIAISHEPVAIEKNNHSGLITFLIIIILLSGYFWYLRISTQKKQHFLYQQWANFEVNSTTESLSLYKRHNQAVEQIIKIPTLKSSELLLNDEVISVVSAEVTQSFSNIIEEQVLTVFAKEHRLKMFNEKQRKIQLRLTDENKTIYLFCLYYRVGNMRHTKLKYSKVINKIIDWHWLFSQVVNRENTEKRKIRVKHTTEKNSTVQHSTVKQASKVNTHNHQHVDDGNNETKTSTKIVLPEPINSLTSANQDNELVSALDKLVEMKKQGYLSENEFNTAKAKILKNLVRE